MFLSAPAHTHTHGHTHVHKRIKNARRPLQVIMSPTVHEEDFVAEEDLAAYDDAAFF